MENMQQQAPVATATKVATKVSTKVKIAIMIGAAAIAAAAVVSPALRPGQVIINAPARGAQLSGTQVFEARAAAPKGYGMTAVTFTVNPGKASFAGAYDASSDSWRASVDTKAMKDGRYTVRIEATFNNLKSGRTAKNSIASNAFTVKNAGVSVPPAPVAVPAPLPLPSPFTKLVLPTSTLTPGVAVPAKFSASATGGDAALKELGFEIHKPADMPITANQTSSIRIAGLGSDIAGTTTLSGCDAGSTKCFVTSTFADQLVIAGGFSKTFELRLIMGTPIKSDDVVETFLVKPGDGMDSFVLSAVGSFGVTAPEAVGSVTITRVTDDPEVASGLVIGGASGVKLAKFSISAAKEDIEIRRLVLSSMAAPILKNVRLMDEGGRVIAGPVSTLTNSGDILFLDMFTITKDVPKVVTVVADLGPVGLMGVPTGTSAFVNFTQALSDSFEAHGVTSNATISSFIVGSSQNTEKFVVKSRPTVSLNALPTAVLTNGIMPVLRFTVSADPAGDVALKGLTFGVDNHMASGTVLVGDGSAVGGVRRVGTASNIDGSITMPAPCAAGASCSVSVMFNSEEVIAAGTSRTYDARLRIDGALSGDSVATHLLGDTSYSVPTPLRTASGTPGYVLQGVPANFVWSDMSAIPHSDAIDGSYDWMMGTYVKVLPTNMAVLSK